MAQLSAYHAIWTKYKEELPEFPSLRRTLVGSIIKETRVDKGIRQMDFAKQTGINESTLKSIENDHQQATTVENLERCAKPLGLTADEIILLGRERDPANYFVFKKTPPRVIKGIRKRKRSPDEWRESLRLQFKNFDLTPISPPIATKMDFFVSKIVLPPKRSIEQMKLAERHFVIGFIPAGFNIKLRCQGKEAVVTGNQSFALNGHLPHSIANDDEDHAAVIYLVTKLHRLENGKNLQTKKEDGVKSIDIAYGIEQIRKFKSEREDCLISVKHLSDLTDSLDHEQVAKLMRIKNDSSVIYWEKIEDLLSGTGIFMEEFLSWCHHEEKNEISIGTITHRALIDYNRYHGVKIYSALPPGTTNEFFMGELMMEPSGQSPRKVWERKDDVMIALYVEEGDLEVTVGRKKSALPLLKGESIYFDGSLGYILRNPGNVQMRAFFASSPGILF